VDLKELHSVALRKVVEGAFMFPVPSGLLNVDGIWYMITTNHILNFMVNVSFFLKQTSNQRVLIFFRKILSCYALCMHPPCCRMKVQDPNTGARHSLLIRVKAVAANMTLQAKVVLLMDLTKKLCCVVQLYL
jgi:hypothetical protein